MNRFILIAIALSFCGLVASGLDERRWESQPVRGADVGSAQDPAPAKAPADETDRQRLERKVKKLLEDNGTKATQKASLDQMMVQFEKMGLPQEFGEQFVDRFDLDKLLDMAVKVHADHLDEETVDALIAFFKTPAGRKVAESTPDISTEMIKLGAEYGERIGREVGETLGK